MIPLEESFTVPVGVAPATCAYAWPVPKILMAAIPNIHTASVNFRTNLLGGIEILLSHRRTGTFHNLTDLRMRARDLHMKLIKKHPLWARMKHSFSKHVKRNRIKRLYRLKFLD